MEQTQAVPTTRSIELMCQYFDILTGMPIEGDDGSIDKVMEEMNELATFMLRYGSDADVAVPEWLRD